MSHSLRILSDAEAIGQAAADEFVHSANEAISARGRFTVALSGGSTPKRLYQILAAKPKDTLAWSKIYLFWGDERAVPPTHADSNYRTVYDELIRPLGIAEANVVRMEAERPDRDAVAREYETKLTQLAGSPPVLDLVLLGMGPDGHTASLFPHNAALGETKRDVVPVFGAPKPPPDRLTLTAALINRAREVLFLVAGADKADALHEVIEGTRNSEMYPSQLVQPTSGKLLWLVDRAAAAKLSSGSVTEH